MEMEFNFTNISDPSHAVGEADVLHLGIGITLVVFAIAATVGNSLVLILIWRFKALRTFTNFLIINLAIADLGISLFGFPITATMNFGHKGDQTVIYMIDELRERNVSAWIMGTVGCQWYGFTGMLFGLANVGFLTTISIDRYLLTCKHSVFLEMGFRHYIWFAVVAWSNAGFWAIGPLIGWSRYAVDPIGMSCSVNRMDRTGLYMSYVLSVFVVSFLIPGIVIIACYTKTWRFIKAVGDGGNQENIEWTHEKQVAKMCAVAISLFLIAWTPYAILCLWAAFGDAASLPFAMAALPPLFAKSSACYNPFLYALLNKRFRLAIQQLCGFVRSNRGREEIRLHQLIQ